MSPRKKRPVPESPEQQEQSESSKEDSEEEEEEEEEEEKKDEEEEEFDSPDSIRKLLDPFGKDQLIDLMKEAFRSNPAILQKITATAESDTTHRKIFVHGLGWDVSTETVAAVFREYGEVEDCNVVMDRITGKSKGYGFVLFRRRADAQKALEQPQKKIGNRMAACQLAAMGSVQVGGVEKKGDVRKAVLDVTGIGTGLLQPNDLALTYGVGSVAGMNPTASLVGQGAYPAVASGILGQNPALASLGSSSMNRAGTNTADHITGLGFSGGAAVPGVNSVSPSIIGNYGAQVALHGLGPYQSSQPPSSAGLSTRSKSGLLGSNLSPYLAPR